MNMLTVQKYQQQLTQTLNAYSDTADLDAYLLISHVIQKTREQLYADPALLMTTEQKARCDQLLQRRLTGEPMAYLLGCKSFWTMDLHVSLDTLVPRPETECLVQWILSEFKDQTNLTIAELGTGTGAIAIALALEKPYWQIDATDQSHSALTIAKNNAQHYYTKYITFFQGDWCAALPKKNYDVIVSNPPYIAENDIHLTKLTFEPRAALVSGADGLNAIRTIIQQAKKYLCANGVLVLEHGYDQATAVCALLKNAGYQNISSHRDLSGVSRFVTARK